MACSICATFLPLVAFCLRILVLFFNLEILAGSKNTCFCWSFFLHLTPAWWWRAGDLWEFLTECNNCTAVLWDPLFPTACKLLTQTVSKLHTHTCTDRWLNFVPRSLWQIPIAMAILRHDIWMISEFPELTYINSLYCSLQEEASVWFPSNRPVHGVLRQNTTHLETAVVIEILKNANISRPSPNSWRNSAQIVWKRLLFCSKISQSYGEVGDGEVFQCFSF